MSADMHRSVALGGEADVEGFRRAARALLAAGVPPGLVSWHVAAAAEGDLFADASPVDAPGRATPAAPDAAAPAASAGSTRAATLAAPAPIPVPAFFVPLCERALLHADPNRWGLMYRLLWRLVHEPALRHDPLDADRLQAELLARAVRRDMHKMTAFVRFRPVALMADEGDGGDDGGGADPGTQHIAWFEPEHHVVEATAPFFARRFAQMQWAILTPERSVRWAGRALVFGPGARKQDAPPADAAEALWLTYYQSIFNPARLKLKMMQKEMPKRYWKNLPEAVLIEPLAAASAQRTAAMIVAGNGGGDAGSVGDEHSVGSSGHHSGHRSDDNINNRGTGARRRPAMSIALRLDQRPASSTAPGTLAALHEAVQRCRECPIGAHATQAVNGEGPPRARLMLVGEQPGDQEDLRGRPFVGPAGQLLDRALAHLGWPRDAVFLTNAVRHFKFEVRGKRRIHKTPAQQEQAACLHWLEREIALVQPEAVVALGATAARALLGRAVPVLQARGRWHARSDGLRVLVTLHPSALLRGDPAERDTAWRDWLADLAQAAEFGAPAGGGGEGMRARDEA